MKKTLLGVSLMIVAAVMMGCMDSFTPCTTDEECTIDFPFGENSAAFEGPGMVCNLDLSPQDKCDEMFGWLVDLPFPILIPIPDCSELSDVPGVCEIDFGF
jgi:hypothetical protein